jgi:hypothetical protein
VVSDSPKTVKNERGRDQQIKGNIDVLKRFGTGLNRYHHKIRRRKESKWAWRRRSILTLELNCDEQSIRSSLMKRDQYRYDDRNKEKKGRRSGNGWHSVPHGALGAILKLSSGGRMGKHKKN